MHASVLCNANACSSRALNTTRSLVQLKFCIFFINDGPHAEHENVGFSINKLHYRAAAKGWYAIKVRRILDFLRRRELLDLPSCTCGTKLNRKRVKCFKFTIVFFGSKQVKKIIKK